MKQSLKSLTAILFLAFCANQLFAQAFENNYVWHSDDHAAWKVEPGSPFGYVIAGNKFFEPNNTSMYFTGFDEFGTHQWTRSHVATGYTSLQSFWKSFVRTQDDGWLTYFAVASGQQGGNKAYAIAVNSNGMKLWDQSSVLPYNIQFGGVCVATNGGFVATGGTGSGNFAIVKFDGLGFLQWAYELPVSGFGWTIAPAVGGGYVIAGSSKTVVKVSTAGAYEASYTVSIPSSPSGAYTYTEFEEITPILDGSGFIVTGSCFSNSHSGIYTARMTYAGGTTWSKINDEVNTSGAGTPVAWVNNAIIEGNNVLTSWRRGPVSAGGTMYYQRTTLAGVNVGGVTSMGNVIPVREAFMTKAHSKYVVGGTRGNLASAYSYVNASLPAIAASDDRTEPFIETPDPLKRLQVNSSNANPMFEYPQASRVFASKMRVFPNPSTGQINVGGAIEPGAQLRVLSPLGNVIVDREIQPDESLIQLDLFNLAPGLYSVEMVGKSGITTQKVIIQ